MGKDLKGKELGEGITQRKNGSYCGRYVNRFGDRKSIYDKDLRVVKKKLNEARYENDNGLNIIDESCTLDMWFLKWMSIYKADVIRENTKRHYTHIYKTHISPTLGQLPISQITKLQITALIGKLKKNGMGWETQNKVRIMLNDMFNKALDDNFVRRNPAKGTRTASNKPKIERRVLTKEEQSLFFECASGTFYNNLFVVAVNTGLRPGELFALTSEDINFNDRTISVSKTLVYQKYLEEDSKNFHIEPPKTTQSNRKVPMNALCETALKRQFIQKKIISRKCPKHTEFPSVLFTTKYNTPLNSVLYSEAIDRIVEEINLMRDDMDKFEHFSGHTFRHTFATRCIESGVKPKTLQTYLGHSTLQMTMDLYVHITNDVKESEMLLLENELSKICVDAEYIDKLFEASQEPTSNVYNMDGVRLA